MDPLSLTASLIAIGTAATTALQISKSLYDFARGYKSAGTEIENFALDLRSFASVVQLGQDSLERHRKNTPSSQVLRYIESLDVLTQLASQSTRTTSSIERVWQQTQTLKNDKLVTKVKWMAKKSEVRGLKPDMESLKSSLHLVMAAITMEALQHSGSQDLQDEIKSLKQQIQMQLETIKFLQESQERHRLELGDNSENLPFRLLNPDAQRALVGLGESMVRNGTVPDIDQHERSLPDGSPPISQIPDDDLEQGDSPEWVDSHELVAPLQTVDPALKDAEIISWASIYTMSTCSGLISGPNGKRIPQSPAYAPNLTKNIISESLAISLGTTLTQLYIPNVYIDFGYGRIERCVGLAWFSWWSTKEQSFNIFGMKGNIPYSSRITITCLIFRNSVSELTLAEDYRGGFLSFP